MDELVDASGASAPRSDAVATPDSQPCGCAKGGLGVSAFAHPNAYLATSDPRVMAPPDPGFVYAIGNVEARFPSLSVEKEFAQALVALDSTGLNDQQAFRAVLSQPENRYLGRQLCWVLTVQGLDTYVLRPRDSGDFSLLIDAIRPEPSPLDLDSVIGLQGPLAPPAMCNGLTVPIVVFDQIYSFDRASFATAVPRSGDLTDAQNDAMVQQVLTMILRIADNAGATDEHRALNYLAMRYADVYTKTGDQFAADCSLSGIEVRPSALGGERRVVDCIFRYTSRKTGYDESFVVAVDVTEEFPFLVMGLVPHFDRVSRF